MLKKRMFLGPSSTHNVIAFKICTQLGSPNKSLDYFDFLFTLYPNEFQAPIVYRLAILPQ